MKPGYTIEYVGNNKGWKPRYIECSNYPPPSNMVAFYYWYGEDYFDECDQYTVAIFKVKPKTHESNVY